MVSSSLKWTFYFALFFTFACSERPGDNIDAEPVIALIGGAVLGTQNNAVVASHKAEVSSPSDKLFRIFNPLKEAHAAAPACPDITGGSCVGSDLVVFYDNCETTGTGRSGYWRTHVKYELNSPADCATLLANGFNSTTLTALTGQTITRQFGVDAAGDENNIRAAKDNTVAYFYSHYPSGWQDDRMGGVDVTFQSSTQRRMVVQGVHLLGILHRTAPVPDPSSFNLMELATTSGDATVTTAWDHTINTVKTGDTLFTIGPAINRAGDGTITYVGLQNNTVSSFDGDMVVNSNTVQKGATFRIQHNMSSSIGVASVTAPLVYSDPTCCYPTSGTLEVVYDLSLKSPTLKETVVFSGTSCGAINYTTAVFHSASRTLSHCF